MMVDVIDTRVTRSLSSELQARAVQSSYYLRHDVSAYNPQQQNHLIHHGQNEAGDGGLDFGVSGLNFTHMGSSYMRNTSEEIYLNNLIDPTMVASSSGMEGLILLDPLQPSNGAQAHRGNSEELFHNWITSTAPMETANAGAIYNDSTGGHRTRRRISSELQAIIAQQNGSNLYARSDHVDKASLQTNSFLADEMVVSDDSQRHRGSYPKEAGEIGQSENSPLSPFKSVPWFNANSPMTRSRSSELQRRYAQMVGLPFPPSAEALQKLVTKGTHEVNPAVATLGAFARGINSGSPPQSGASPPVPPTTGAHTQIEQPPMEQQGNHLSAAISMLKGSLERKKLSSKQQQQHQHQQAVMMPVSEGGARQDESLHMSTLPVDSAVGKQRHNDCGQTPQLGQPNILLNAHSPSESAGGAPAHSAGITSSDGPSNSGMSAHRQALKRGNLSSVDQPSPKRHYSGFDVPSPSFNAQSSGDMNEGVTTKSETRNKGGELLSRAGSITSSVRSGFQVSDIDDATKKRRVERQRKMAEAKGRGNTPPMPADLEAAVKRCDSLEKEVRSLKLNLSFMNRKDSEQTKRIEELEKQNEDLQEEKDKLLEELERLNSMNDPSGTL